MDLNFKVINQKLIKKEKKYLVSKSDNYLRLFFDFETTDWNKLNIYIILRNEEDESYQFHYDKEGIVVPYDVVKNKHFFVSVYGTNDEYRITTNVVKVKLFSSGYTNDISSVEESSKDIIVELDEKINGKVGFDDVSRVGLSGEYNDLKNIPSEFTPSYHEHEEYATHLEVDEKILIHDSDLDSHSDIRESIPSNVSDLINDLGFINEHQSLNDYYAKRDVDNYLNGKVDKVTGKGLSSEDYTTNEKNKLASLENYTHPLTHSSSIIIEENELSNIGVDSNSAQNEINLALNNKIGELESIKFIRIVSEKPVPSEDTMNTLYIVSEDNKVNVYYTKYDNEEYTWKKMDTDILDELNIDWSDINNKPLTFTPSNHTHNKSEIVDLNLVSSSNNGLMSSTDKNKIDNMNTVEVTVNYTDGTNEVLNLYYQED